MPEDNSHAGQGPVVLDIGDDIGALIVSTTAALAGVEIEARPIAGAAKATLDAALARHWQAEPHDHALSDHSHADHHHHHPHSPGPALVHVGVLGRPSDGQLVYSAVFGELQDGTYELYLRPAGPVQLIATVRGGQVSLETWPSPSAQPHRHQDREAARPPGIANR